MASSCVCLCILVFSQLRAAAVKVRKFRNCVFFACVFASLPVRGSSFFIAAPRWHTGQSTYEMDLLWGGGSIRLCYVGFGIAIAIQFLIASQFWFFRFPALNCLCPPLWLLHLKKSLNVPNARDRVPCQKNTATPTPGQFFTFSPFRSLSPSTTPHMHGRNDSFHFFSAIITLRNIQCIMYRVSNSHQS